MGASTNRVWHLAFSQRRKLLYAGDTFQGVKVSVLQVYLEPIIGYKKVMLKGIAAEAYLWSFVDGFAGLFNAPARTSR